MFLAMPLPFEHGGGVELHLQKRSDKGLRWLMAHRLKSSEVLDDEIMQGADFLARTLL